MTLDTFAAITDTRIPTADEFLAFVDGMGWQVVKSDAGRAALRVTDTKDPFAVALAKMLSREPWRTRVLERVTAKTVDAPPQEWQAPLPPREEKPQPIEVPFEDDAVDAGGEVVGRGEADCLRDILAVWGMKFLQGVRYRWELVVNAEKEQRKVHYRRVYHGGKGYAAFSDPTFREYFREASTT